MPDYNNSILASAEVFSLSRQYPLLWNESPGQFSDYSMEDGKYIIDPWVYPKRMGMYKILLNKTASYFEKFAPDNEQNFLWGLPLQHSWQYITGRLVDLTRTTDCGYESGDRLCISVDSWWADMNYFLCALPFLAAVDSGIMGISSDQVLLLPPPKDQTKFCLSVSSCQSSFPSTMRKWNALYKHLQSPSSSFEDLLKYLWEAHVSSLKDGYKIFEDRLEYYSKPEAGFGKDWCVVLDYLAAASFPTIFSTVSEFQKALPPRVLVDGDRAPFISDFTDLQNIVLLGLNRLHEVDSATDQSGERINCPRELPTKTQTSGGAPRSRGRTGNGPVGQQNLTFLDRPAHRGLCCLWPAGESDVREEGLGSSRQRATTPQPRRPRSRTRDLTRRAAPTPPPPGRILQTAGRCARCARARSACRVRVQGADGLPGASRRVVGWAGVGLPASLLSARACWGCSRAAPLPGSSRPRGGGVCE
ncbi:protein LEG1 homolog [Capricornis sumatraensis]|uniref:protein LEG1 homolog n=1 Tax=Capricornis sumatraensis TaxID=34865 RepID=UPI003604675D